MAATTVKRKKLEKVDRDDKEANSQRFYCCRCGHAFSRQKGYFPVSHSPMYRSNGYLPWCNDCVEDMYDQYRESLGDDKLAMHRMCMKMDLYWSEAIYAMVEKMSGVQSRIRNYIGKTNIIRYIDKTYDDTISEGISLISDARATQRVVTVNADSEDGDGDATAAPVITITQSVIDFWGPGFAPDFYAELERRYRDWTGGNDITDPAERSLYRQICMLETMISRDSAQGKAIDKNVSTLNALLGSMNLKPTQRKEDADAELEKMPLGVGIQKWEYSRPLPKTPEDLCDQSGRVKNITTWFLGHVCKMVGLRNGYCKMYEQAMDELRVKRPEYADEDDDTLLYDIFHESGTGGG